jgi:hypothetical protein
VGLVHLEALDGMIETGGILQRGDQRRFAHRPPAS